jgi:serine O-acetyltransferase
LSLLNVTLFGLEVPATLHIGPGLIIAHTNGIVLGAAVIGRNATIYQQVTLGALEADFRFDPALRPVVEDDVILAAGAKVLGAVRIGSGSTVGANAVVLSDVPPAHIAVGVPARVKPKASK